MGRLIDADELVKKCMNGIDNEFITKINEAPTVCGWIPVSERLPNFNDIVLASADTDYDELRVILTVYGAEEFWFNGKIKAWMPLPEPYKESEDKGYESNI